MKKQFKYKLRKTMLAILVILAFIGTALLYDSMFIAYLIR